MCYHSNPEVDVTLREHKFTHWHCRTTDDYRT